MSERPHVNRGRIVAVLLVFIVASAGVVAEQIYVRWHGVEVKTAEQARYQTTGEAAKAAGAKVIPTDPKLSIVPKPLDQKNPEQPANPN